MCALRFALLGLAAVAASFTVPALSAENAAVTVSVDVNANRHAINPFIYGVAHATTTQLIDLNVPLNRQGGNNTSRYNWQVNGDNRGQDWYFESIGETSSTPGERVDTFIANTRAGAAQPMITVPIISWIAKLGANRSKLASFSISKYGAQTGNDAQWFPDAGNGIWTSGQKVTGNDPSDANVPNSPSLQAQWIQTLVNRWGMASGGGQRYYILDNEPSIWFATHRDVQPTGPTMEEVLQRMTDYASAIKNVDPGALVAGPEEWGWSGYFYSGYDQQYGNTYGWGGALPDRSSHGGADYLPWLLSSLKNDGRHLLDLFTVHYYPQGGEFSNDVSTTAQLLRNRSTRSLWDANYVDQSWINAKVMLIPRLRNWVNAYYYPGTPIGITEYNWGAEGHINGATAQADIIGIFGREGLDMAARWTTPGATTPTYKAIKMYRNYDGNQSTFGDTSIAATAPNPDDVAVFAAQRTRDSAVTIMVISKYLSGTTPVTINVANFAAAGTAQAYQLTAANAITRLPDIAFSASSVPFTAPPQSITLLVLPEGTPNQPPVAVASATPASGYAPLTVQFDATGSSDPDGSILTYSWNFGDGTASGSGATLPHVYTTNGNYTAVLTVTDNRGATGTTSLAISALVDPSFIPAPSNLTASAGKGNAKLSWRNNAGNATGITVERAPSKSSSFAVIATLSATASTYTNTVPRGTYQYRVRAFNSGTGLTSAYSNTVTVSVR